MRRTEGEERRARSEGRGAKGEERSNERKAVSYAGRRYVTLLSLRSSLPSPLVLSHLSPDIEGNLEH